MFSHHRYCVASLNLHINHLTKRGLHTTLRRRERQRFDASKVERESDEVDVCIVGAGPAGLSAAIRLKQLANEKSQDIRVVVLEKGAEVGKPFLD